MERDTDELDAPRGGRASWQAVTLVAMAMLGAAVLFALVVTLRGANEQRDRALRLQAHSYDVMILARRLAGTIARSEASLGRYVISGDRQLGQLYVDEWNQAGDELDQLDRITDDNPAQQPRIDRLRAAYQARGTQLALTALSTNYGKNDQALARYYQARKAASLTAIDAALDEIIDREHAILVEREENAAATVDHASRLAGVLAVFGFLIVAGATTLGWFTVRAVGERAAARAETEVERARTALLTEAVEAATSELRAQEAKLRQAQKMDAVGQLTGGIAHDFNNMLAVVSGGLELARRNLAANPEAARRHIDSAAEGADRAAALTRRLLTFSREESLKAEPIVVASLVAGMSEMIDRSLGDAVTIVIADHGEGWQVRGDRVQLENAILNLAVNARDAMDGRGTLTITTATRPLAEHEIDHCAAGDYVTLAVTDTGHGMTPDVAERVFEPFFTTKDADKGTGLGLSQIFALVRQMEGAIAIDTAPGAGTTVTLFLPREFAVAAGPVRIVAAPTATAAFDPLEVLVVEDDPRVLIATMGALEELGHHPTACDDPAKAHGLIIGHGAIDLIVTDVLMPRQTGPEMIATLAPAFPHIAVLFVTGFAGDATASGVAGHEVLRKPFTLAALEQAVARAMARDRPEAPHRLAAE